MILKKTKLQRINYLELDLIVLSTSYSRYNYSLVSDDEYDKRSFELARLIKDNPSEFKKSKGYKIYKEFNPSTSLGLDSSDPKICNIVEHLIKGDKDG